MVNNLISKFYDLCYLSKIYHSEVRLRFLLLTRYEKHVKVKNNTIFLIFKYLLQKFNPKNKLIVMEKQLNKYLYSYYIIFVISTETHYHEHNSHSICVYF